MKAAENLGEIMTNVLRTQAKLQQTVDRLVAQGAVGEWLAFIYGCVCVCIVSIKETILLQASAA